MVLPALPGYRVLRSVGVGGMAELFLAERDSAGGARRRVVLKRILPGFALDPRFRQRFVHEARLALQLTHANIVQVYDFRETDDTYVLEMEYVDGCDLRRLLRDGPLPLACALQITVEVLRGLDYAHRRIGSDGIALEIVHRDVAPGNILLSREGEVKLTDFGLARSREQLERSVGGVHGTFSFIAPEQAEGLPVDRRADLFSVGAVLYAAATGESPFAADGPLATLERVRAARWQPWGAPPEVEQIVARALQRDPAQRFPSAAAMREALEAACVQLQLRPSVDALAERVRRVVTAEPSASAASPAASDGGRAGVAQISVEPISAEDASSSSPRPVTQRLAHAPSSRRRPAIAAALLAVVAVACGAEYARRRARPSGAPHAVLGARVAAPIGPDAVLGAPVVAPIGPDAVLGAPVAAPIGPDAVLGAPVAAPTARVGRVAARPRTAYLTVSADPWAYVAVDGKRRGTTPLVDLALAPGAHELTLDNPEFGASRARVVRLAPDEHRTVIERLTP